MVDTFLLLALARTGDQLQGIKKGILELVDVIAVNKADGEHAAEARMAARELSGALRLLAQVEADQWRVPVLTCSGLDGTGVAAVWQAVVEHRQYLVEHDLLQARRGEQQVSWMIEAVHDQLISQFESTPRVVAALPQLSDQVRSGQTTPLAAAHQLLGLAPTR